ncbi:MAG TPA: glycine cleavage system protein GcvH [Candidatus Methanomethylophilaceae archaeon]|nr:glycine cleavage system protein GcvH [Candidatus Methanomethylophilaceae archaeon]
MTTVKEGFYYTKEGIWVEIRGTKARIGISDRAQDDLGEVIYVQPPVVGRSISKNDEIGAIESFKAIAPTISPVTGTISAINLALEGEPALMNSSPYEKGWLAEIELDDTNLDGLLTADEYKAL